MADHKNSNLPDLVETVRARLNDGRHVSDNDVRQVLAVVDTLRRRIEKLSEIRPTHPVDEQMMDALRFNQDRVEQLAAGFKLIANYDCSPDTMGQCGCCSIFRDIAKDALSASVKA